MRLVALKQSFDVFHRSKFHTLPELACNIWCGIQYFCGEWLWQIWDRGCTIHHLLHHPAMLLSLCGFCQVWAPRLLFQFFHNYMFVLQEISKTTFNNNHSNKTFSKIFALNRPNYYCSKIIKYLKKYSVSQTREWIRQDPFRDQGVAGPGRNAENSLIFVCLRPPSFDKNMKKDKLG